MLDGSITGKNNARQKVNWQNMHASVKGNF